MGLEWENMWFLDIKDPSIWGRLTEEQKKEHLEKETGAKTIGGDNSLKPTTNQLLSVAPEYIMESTQNNHTLGTSGTVYTQIKT